MTTLVLGRSLLRLRQAEVEERIHPTSGRASPFGVVVKEEDCRRDVYSFDFEDPDKDGVSELDELPA